MARAKRCAGLSVCLIMLCLASCSLKSLTPERLEEQYGKLSFCHVVKSGQRAVICSARDDGIYVFQEVDSNNKQRFLLDQFLYQPVVNMALNSDGDQFTVTGIKQFGYAVDENAFPKSYTYLRTDRGFIGIEGNYWAPTYAYHSYGGHNPAVNIESILCTGYTLSIVFADDCGEPSTLYERLPYMEFTDDQKEGIFTVRIHGELGQPLDTIETVLPDGWQIYCEESVLRIDCPVSTSYTVEHYTDASNGVTLENDQGYPVLIDTFSASGPIEVVLHFTP